MTSEDVSAPADGAADPVDVTTEDGLVSRLAVIEAQPLESRAAAYAGLHDRLQARLEGGDVPRSANG